jgi:hypothetical protein
MMLFVTVCFSLAAIPLTAFFSYKLQASREYDAVGYNLLSLAALPLGAVLLAHTILYCRPCIFSVLLFHRLVFFLIQSFGQAAHFPGNHTSLSCEKYWL